MRLPQSLPHITAFLSFAERCGLIVKAYRANSSNFKKLNISMATSINRLVASSVFRNHPVSKGGFETITLRRVAKRPSFLSLFFPPHSANLRLDAWKL